MEKKLWKNYFQRNLNIPTEKNPNVFSFASEKMNVTNPRRVTLMYMQIRRGYLFFENMLNLHETLQDRRCTLWVMA